MRAAIILLIGFRAALLVAPAARRCVVGVSITKLALASGQCHAAQILVSKTR